MNTIRTDILAGAAALLLVFLNGVAATPTNAPQESSTSQVSEAPTLSEDVKAKVDGILDAKMGEFVGTACDYLLKLAPQETLVPHLIQVLQDEDRDWIARQRAANALAKSGDPRGATAFLQLIRAYLRPREEMLSFAQSQVLYTCIHRLSWFDTEETVEEAFKILKPEYWSAKGLPVPKEKIPTRPRQDTVDTFRHAALLGLAMGGTDHAVKALETREGIPRDLLERYRGEMQSLLDVARKAREERLRDASGIR